MLKKITKELTNPINYFFLFISFIYMLILSKSTSPIICDATSDSGIFLEVGREIASGKILFTEIFDHKGPLLFFINSIPQFFISGTLGVWLVQVLFMFISLILIFKISKKFINSIEIALIPVFIYMAASIYTIQYGNVSEEYSNLFAIISLYIFSKFYFSNKTKLSFINSILLGVSFMSVAMIRINNAPTIVAVTIYIFFSLLAKKEFKETFKFVIFFIIGSLIILIPILIYFIYNDSLYEFIYGTFLFNMMYTGNSFLDNLFFLLFTVQSKFKTTLWIFIIVYFIGILISIMKKNLNLLLFLTLNTLITISVICLSGSPFMHYIITGVPLLCFSSIIVLKEVKFKPSISTLISLLIILTTSTWIGYFGINRIITSLPTTKNYKEASLDLASNIDFDENNIFSYNQEARWLFFTKTTPINRYFTLQDWWNKTDPNVYKELEDSLKNSTPTWIITSNPKKVKNKDLSKMENTFIMNYIKNYYTEVDRNHTGILYKVNK